MSGRRVITVRHPRLRRYGDNALTRLHPSEFTLMELYVVAGKTMIQDRLDTDLDFYTYTLPTTCRLITNLWERTKTAPVRTQRTFTSSDNDEMKEQRDRLNFYIACVKSFGTRRALSNVEKVTSLLIALNDLLEFIVSIWIFHYPWNVSTHDFYNFHVTHVQLHVAYLTNVPTSMTERHVENA